MTHVVHDPIESLPLESFGSVERRVSLRFGRTVAAAEVRAGWADIELRMIQPPHLAGITLREGGAGLAAALGERSDPSRRFTYRGELTARALLRAQEFIIQVLRDHDFVERHTRAIAARCVAVHERLARIDAQIRELAGTGGRAALRRAFKSGALNQREHQAVVREINERCSSRRSDLECTRREANEFVAEGIGRRPIRFDHALIHLRDPHILGTIDPAMRERLASLGR